MFQVGDFGRADKHSCTEFGTT